jgi:hypothetical protein
VIDLAVAGSSESVRGVVNIKRRFYDAGMDEGRKRVIAIIAGILLAHHMDVADDLFGGPQGSPNPWHSPFSTGLGAYALIARDEKKAPKTKHSENETLKGSLVHACGTNRMG